jgi:hypothetical protein
VIFDIGHFWLTAILGDNERPLSYGSKGLRQVDMRNDFWLRDALMRQRRNDQPIYFFAWNRLGFFGARELRRYSGGQECAAQ